MKNRIKEIMKEAGFDPDSIQRMGIMPQAEKFAELVWKEAYEAGHDKGVDAGFNAGSNASFTEQNFVVESSSEMKPTISVYGWVWKDKRHEDGCCYVPSYTPATPYKNGELLALVDPKDLKDPLENTKWR